MSLVTLASAKLHLRVTGTDEDTLIQDMLDTAEKVVHSQLGRNVYVDSTALTAAKSAAPTALTTAGTTYDAAVTAALANTNDTESALMLSLAVTEYYAAGQDFRRTMQGIVTNKNIQAAVLLLVGHYYANREATTAQLNGLASMQLPLGVDSVLQPYKVYE